MVIKVSQAEERFLYQFPLPMVLESFIHMIKIYNSIIKKHSRPGAGPAATVRSRLMIGAVQQSLRYQSLRGPPPRESVLGPLGVLNPEGRQLALRRAPQRLH